MGAGEKAAPACAIAQNPWFAWATAGRPYNGQRDCHGVHSQMRLPCASVAIYKAEKIPIH
jgi:hypothetical protein